MAQSDQKSKANKGFIRRWIGGVFESQRAMASSPRRDQVLRETKEAISRVRRMKVAPTRVDTFEGAVARYGYTVEQLAAQEKRHKYVHWALYTISGALLIYALHLSLAYSVLFGAGAFVLSIATAVNGYIHGFRAWQIQNRNLIRLQDALCIPGTYLVL